MEADNALLSNITTISQMFYATEIQPEEFREACKTLEKSHTFAVYPWTERQLFSLQLREKGDTFKTFELKDGIDAFGVELLSCGLNGI